MVVRCVGQEIPTDEEIKEKYKGVKGLEIERDEDSVTVSFDNPCIVCSEYHKNYKTSGLFGGTKCPNAKNLPKYEYEETPRICCTHDYPYDGDQCMCGGKISYVGSHDYEAHYMCDSCENEWWYD